MCVGQPHSCLCIAMCICTVITHNFYMYMYTYTVGNVPPLASSIWGESLGKGMYHSRGDRMVWWCTVRGERGRGKG